MWFRFWFGECAIFGCGSPLRCGWPTPTSDTFIRQQFDTHHRLSSTGHVEPDHPLWTDGNIRGHAILHDDLQGRAVKHTEDLRAAWPSIDHKVAVVPVEWRWWKPFKRTLYMRTQLRDTLDPQIETVGRGRMARPSLPMGGIGPKLGRTGPANSQINLDQSDQ